MLTPKSSNRLVLVVLAAFSVLLLASCMNMEEQPKLDEPYVFDPNFGTAWRELDPNAIPRGWERDDTLMFLGTVDGEFVNDFPMDVDRELIAEGQVQYESFCTPCHGFAGYGDGILNEEGFPPPASYHTDELRAQPAGYYFDVISNGRGNMLGYGARIEPADRWAIVAYIRALQYSQYQVLDELPPDLQAESGLLNQ
ncbi:MAG: cytochrome c [Chloroflexi bacterium]|nr:cytochrome c [Chloroflexota bacterium]